MCSNFLGFFFRKFNKKLLKILNQTVKSEQFVNGINYLLLSVHICIYYFLIYLVIFIVIKCSVVEDALSVGKKSEFVTLVR